MGKGAALGRGSGGDTATQETKGALLPHTHEGLLRTATDGLDDEPNHDESDERKSDFGDGGNGRIGKTSSGSLGVRNRSGDARRDSVGPFGEGGGGDERKTEHETLELMHW